MQDPVILLKEFEFGRKWQGVSRPRAMMQEKCDKPEWRILLYAARMPCDPAAGQKLCALLKGTVPVPALVELARAHGMLSLLRVAVAGLSEDAAPQALREQLELEHERNARRNLLLSGELVKLLRLLSGHGIPALPYKGPVLAVQAYGDEALRRADDLDLLVREVDAWRAGEIIAAQGFRPEVPIPLSQWRWFMRSECDQVFVHPQSRMYVELHWQPVPPYFSVPFRLEPVLDRARPVNLAGSTVPGLSPEDLLLLLCVHGTKHVWERLEWVCAIASVIRNQAVEWDSLLVRAAEMRSRRMLLLGLDLARDLAAASLPPGIWSEIRSCRHLVPLAGAALAQMQLVKPPRGLRLLLFRLRAREHVPDRIRYCFRRLVTPTYRDLLAVRLPRPLSFLYYVVRPLRGILRVAGLSAGKKRGRQGA